MKKKIIYMLVCMLVISTFTGIVSSSEPQIKYSNEEITILDFTHTVFGEDGTATWCGYCKYAHGALKEIYAEGQYPFYYVTLVDDKNSKAASRVRSDYNIYGFPTVWFDGGYRVNVGAGSIPSAKSNYINSIITSGSRTVEDIDIDLSVVWRGGTEMEIDVTVDNNEASTYGGYIRVYITEIESSMGWYDTAGELYTFPLLDYAFDEPLSIPAGGFWSDSTNWDGSANGFSTITQNNIMVIAVVFNDEKHLGYSYPPSNNPFDAYYVDETAAATPGSGSESILDIQTINGGLFKVKSKIKNKGDTEVTDVNWSITLDGGAFIGKETTGTIPSIPTSGEVEISSNYILGIGPTTVTVNAEIPEDSDKRSQEGFILLFFISIKPGG